jgi:AcrR family transcriptional regulator
VNPKRKTPTREALIEGAIECLRERGFARTTARDVVAAAGVNLGAIGYHFGSMDALLAEAVATVFRRWLSRIQSSVTLDDETSFEDLLLQVCTEAAKVFKKDRGLAAAFLEGIAQAERSPALRRQMNADYQRLREEISTLLLAALGARLPESERARIASAFMAIDVGMMAQALLDPKSVLHPEEVVAALASFAKLFDRSSKTD